MSQTRALILQGDEILQRTLDALEANAELDPAERRAEEEIFAEHLAAIEALGLDEVELIERLAAVVRAARARAEALRAEYRLVRSACERADSTADRCRDAIGQLLTAREARELEPHVRISIGKVGLQVNSVASLVAPRELSWWEARGFVEYVPTPDEQGLRKALKAGEIVEGASLVRGRHVHFPAIRAKKAASAGESE